MLYSAIVHGHNDGPRIVYEEICYSNDLGELDEGGESLGRGLREISRPTEMYHKMIIIKRCKIKEYKINLQDS